MARKIIDCHHFSFTRLDGAGCTIALVGDEAQLFVEALEHGRTFHGMEDSPEVRDMIRSAMVDAPPALA